ncbi:MAG: strawberry notch family protein [Synergistaceae bacterium]|nr:strawberry notch family protein [Synergistaceae bacterium]
MAVPTLDEALKEAYMAKNSGVPSIGGTPNLDMALSVARAAGNDPYYQRQRELYKDVTPPMELTMPPMPAIPRNPLANVRPEDTLSAAEPPATDFREILGEGAASLGRGVANLINGTFQPSNRETETLKWLATLDDAQVRDAVMKGQIDDRYRRYVMLPQTERQATIQRTLAGQEQYESALNTATGVISHEPRNAGGWLAQTVNKGLEAVPGIAANVAKFSAWGPMGWAAQNALSGNAAAREKVFAYRMAQGDSVPEAAAQADSLGWNAADIATRGATDAAIMATFGAAPNLYGGMSPVLQRMMNVAKGAGVSGLGAAGESVIGNQWSGQDVDWTGAAKSGLGSAATTGLFGLFNMALNAGGIAKEHKTWKFIRNFNDVVKDYGVPPLSENGNNLGDVAGFTENVITSGQLPPDKALEMLTRLGIDRATAAEHIARLSRQPRLNGAQEGDFTGQQRANNPTPPETGPAPALPSGGLPGMTREETARRNSNLWDIVQGGKQVQNAENQRTALGFMERYGVGVMGQRPQPQLPAPLETTEPKGALTAAIDEAKAAEATPEEPKDELKEWFDDHVITGVVGRPAQPKGALAAALENATGKPENVLENRTEPAPKVKKGRYTDINAFVEAATSPEGKKMGGSIYMDFAPISDTTANRIQEATGIDVHGYGHALDGSSVVHILNRHGENGTALKDFPNQTPLTAEDLAMIPDVVENADTIEPSEGRILFKKRVDGHFILVEEKRNRFGKLIPVTARKEKAIASPSTSVTSPAPSGPVSAIPPIEETIPQPAGEVKEEQTQPVKTIPEGAKLKGGKFTVHYEGSTGPMDYEIRAKPKEGSKKGVRRIYLDELREGNTPKPVGYYDVSKDKFVKKKDNFFADEVEKEFRKRLGDFFEQPEPLGTINPKTGLREITIVLSPKEQPEETPKAEETITPHEPQTAKSPSMILAERLAEKFIDNSSLNKRAMTTDDLIKYANEAFGGTMAEGKYSIKDAYDAMEMAVNNTILFRRIRPDALDMNEVVNSLYQLGKIENDLPTQANRTEEQVEFQQFSTPPRIAYIANWLSGAGKGDVVLEPSAGVGGLAVFAKNAGAEVVMNELSDRRAALLKEMGLGEVLEDEHGHGYNAEHIHDILPDDAVRPTKVIMNPPFSSTAGRMKGKKNDTKNATKHVEQALSRLEEGGRLVAILGKGMNDDAPAFRSWWRDIKSRYNVRANILLDGKEYRKYGTSFGNVIVVIDKNGPTPEGGTLTGSFDTVEDLASSKELQQIRDDAPKPEASKPKAEPETETGNKPKTRFPKYHQEKAEAEEAKEPEATDKPRAWVHPSGLFVGNFPEGQDTVEIKTGSQEDGIFGGQKKTSPKAEPKEPAEPTVQIERKTEEERRRERKAKEAETGETGDDLNVYDNYSPSRMKIKGAKHHPADLVESAAMGSVSMPEATYSPRLPERIISEGLLSDAQLEAVTYAGQAFEKKNADGTRRGFFIGDGTGVGKGREISGVLTDQMAQGHGKGKAVWVSDKITLSKDAQRDWSGLGNNPEDIFSQQKTKKNEAIKNGRGICFSAYSTLRDKARLEQLKNWLGKDFDGVVVLDECHNANNATDTKGNRGTRKASAQALAIKDLVRAFPEARVLYVSATGATEVRNLAMLDRLGLWGPGTPFSNEHDFVAKIDAGGTAAMEITARDMKAMGLFVARSLSQRHGPNGGPEDVTFSRLTHELNAHQKAVYDKIAEAWRVTFQNMDKAVKICGGENVKAGGAISAFYGAEQRCLSQVITSLKTPAVIEAIKKDLEEDKSVVIQLTETGDAATKRALANLGEDEGYDDLDVSPRDTLIQFLEASFPVDKLEEYTDEDGNVRMRKVLDKDGNPVQSKEAVRIRDELIADVASITFPETPLDMIINAFGAENVAEITGRGQRVVKGPDGKRARETRSVSSREADKADFNSGKKRILIFSEAGGTGASYHASNEYKNKQKRVHYLLQPGWRADKAIQGLGRTHRSNEAHKPHYVLVETDLPGEKRFNSTIARRLEQTGALTMGERKTTTNGLFGERDNLESVHAKDALKDMFLALIRGDYPDMGKPEELIKQLGYSYDNFKDPTKFPPITQFLNRVMALDVDTQKSLFAHFDDAIDQEIAWAIQHGTLDRGTENVRADKVKALQEKTVYKDPETGAETKYVELELKTKQRPRSLKSVVSLGFDTLYKNKNGAVVAARRTKRTETDTRSGEVLPVYQLASVDPRYHGETKLLDKAYSPFHDPSYEKLDEDEARDLWAKQAAELPEYYTEKKHMITGAILPIWDKLSERSPRIQRVRTEDGQSYLGRLIPESELGLTLARLKVDYKGTEITPEEMFKRLEKLGTTATLANGWRLKTVMVNGEKRIEIIGPDFSWYETLKNAGCMVELVGGYKRRVFIPQGMKSAEAMGRVLDMSPVMDIKARDILDEAAEAINENIPDDVGYRLNIVHPWFAGMAEAATNPLVETAETVFSNPETEKRYQEAKAGVKPETGWDRMKNAARQFLHGFRGDYPELAVGKSESGEDLKPARELIRKLNRETGAQVHKAIRLLEGTLKPLSPREFDIFERAWILMDLKHQRTTMPGSLLPYGLTDEEFERDYDKFMGLMERTPKVKEAVTRMEEINAEMCGRLADVFGRMGWHSLRDKFKNPNYFHHVVLEFANAAESIKGKHNIGKAPDNRSWLKKRRGSDKDISANYIQVMGETFAQMFQDIASGETLNAIKDEYNIIERVKRAAFVANEEAVKEQLAEAARTLNEGLSDEEARESAEAQFRKTFNQKQAMALSRLFTLAKNGDLPEGNSGEFGDVVDAMETAGSVEDLPDKIRKRFNRYLGWLAGLDEESAGTLSARGYFKGVVEKKKKIKTALGDDYLDWRDAIPDGYSVWDPFNSPLCFSVSAVPEKILQLAEKENLKDIHIALADLVKMKVIGGHRQLWVIPTEIAATLDELGERKVKGLAGSLGKELTTLWKKDVLFNPWRLGRYNIRNFTSDLDAAVAGSPGILLCSPRAFTELWNVFRKGRAATGDLKDFQERGGALTADSMQELYEWKNMREFRHLTPRERERLWKRLWRIGSGYMEWAEKWTQFRESLLRYAAYLFFKKDMEKHDGVPTRWGASRPEEVMALKDIRDRAFKMANELLGAYDEVTRSGRDMRASWIPFYSWKEVNFKREVQMFRNLAKGRSWLDADIRLALGRGGAGGGGPKDPTGGALPSGEDGERFHWTSLLGYAMRAPTIALRAAAILATNFWFWGMMYLFNSMVHGEEERRLPQDLQERPHVVTGSNPATGEVYYFDRIGALPDFLENFGLDQFVTDLRQIWNGQKTWGQFLKQIPEGMTSAFWNGMNPLVKMPSEMMLGRTGFPNVFKPRAIRDRLDYLASGLGLKWPVAAIRSLIEDKAGPDFWSLDHLRDFISYTARPKLEAYYHILDLKRQYQENVLGTTYDGFATTKRGYALGQAKTAMRYGDFKKAQRWIDRYYELDGTLQGFKTSVNALDPLAGLSKADRADFEDWLTEQDKKYLEMAEEYYDEMSDALYDVLAGTE